MINFRNFGILMLILFLFSSCKREFEYDENATVEGNWQPIKVRASGTYLGLPFVKYEDANDCQKQSKASYNSDKTCLEIAYDDASGSCQNILNRKFTYQFDTKSKSLKHIYEDGSSKTVEVLSITSNTLIIKTKNILN